MRAVIRSAALLCLTILAALSVTHAQQGGKVPRIGVIGAITNVAQMQVTVVQPLMVGLRELGYENGRNIAFELRSADGQFNRLPAVAAELVALKVDVLFTVVCGAPLNALMQATKTIPIVVAACADDMVESGIVRSLAHPGGNVTGLSKLTPELTAKRLDLLKEMVPAASRVAVLWDPGYSTFIAEWKELRDRARERGVSLVPIEYHLPADLEKAFAVTVSEQADAVLTFSDTLSYVYAGRVAELASVNKLPLISPFREMTNAGALMSYGPNIPDMMRQSAGYVDKILKGASPTDLPVEQATKFEFSINLKAAKALGLSAPTTLLARADEVIE
jgi:putative tryptophan/tyrosine transport system substrate-binding protein